MADISADTDRLLADLGLGGGDSSASASVSVKVSGSAPAPPPPPPPPPPAATASAAPIRLRTGKAPSSSVEDAKKEIDDIFDSVISFAGKTAATKKRTPPPVAPKPKRKIHVSSYTMQIKSPGGPRSDKKPEPPPPTTTASQPLPPPPAFEPKVAVKTSERKASEGGGIVPSQPPVALTAFGPGLETFEVNSIGHFQVSSPHDTTEDDLEIVVTGPSGTKPVDIDDHGNGQFSCSYIPTSAGDHTISIKVNDQHIPGSPFTANVQFAAYTDKCSAEGPGLISGTTFTPCNFTIRCKEDAGYARLRVHIVGPSKAEPIEMTENVEDRSINVVYHPTAPGDYNIRVLWGEAHVRGSPFTVPVTGDTVNDVTRVKLTGEGLKGGSVGEPLKFFVEGEAGAGPGPLGVRMVGPSKPEIVADDSSDEGVQVTFTCRDPGEYQLIVRWGNQEHPDSPWVINITGEGREVKPELCTASGTGLSSGVVGMPAIFTVNIPDEAGPGMLNVSVSGPHPPKPINIVNNQDGTMEVSYHPVCPGEYKIDVLWANQHIKDSPFTSQVSGLAVRNSKAVTASGEVLGGSIKCNQLGTIKVVPGEGAGPGPLRAKLEGPAKAELQLSNNGDGTMLVSFVAKDPGDYNLHLLWGDADADDSEISGSPFLIRVEKN